MQKLFNANEQKNSGECKKKKKKWHKETHMGN